MKLKRVIRILKNETRTKNYLIKKKIIPSKKKCTKCRRISVLDNDQKQYRCRYSVCLSRVGVFSRSIFKNTKKGIDDILQLFYLYLLKTPIQGITMATGYSSSTICRWTGKLRELVLNNLVREQRMIGGEGVIVEIDETKLGKRKYNRGHMVEGVWCVVGVERTESKRKFVCDVENRNADTLKQIIKDNVIPESIIYTDGWKGYKKACEDLGFAHFTVNHSKEFVNKETGVHTNTVEGVNNGLKLSIPVRNRIKKGIEGHLAYYIWRNENKKDLWKGLLECLRRNFN